MKVRTYDNKFSFHAGLTKQMQSEISTCNTKKIESYFENRNIGADFKNNKIIAWCSLKCIQIIDGLNKKYGLNLGLPNGIFVEDFRNLNGANSEALGLTNFAPVYLYKSKDVIVPEKTIFFNTYNINWDKLDKIADESFENSTWTTDFFLEGILHEFMHVLHENNMIKKLGGINFIELLNTIQSKEIINEFRRKHAKLISNNICHYAAVNPVETIACDLVKRNIKCLDKENIVPKSNTFNKKPYNTRFFLSKDKDTDFEKLLRKYWNGNLMA